MGLFSKIGRELKRAYNKTGLGSLLNPQAPGDGGAAKAQKAQLALLTAQQTAAQNALADLSLANTPDIVAGGTADILMGTTKRKKNNQAQSISSSLGLS